MLKIVAAEPRAPRLLDQAALGQRLHRRLRGDAADPRHLRARHRLQIGDDRQRLGLRLGQRRGPRLGQQPPRRGLARRVAGEREAPRDLAQDDAAAALGEVLAQQLDRLADLALGRLARLRQVRRRDRLRREEEKRLDRPREVAHALRLTLWISIGPSGLRCFHVTSPLR